jgi:type II secretory pathway component GspD/PulD (secretin)
MRTILIITIAFSLTLAAGCPSVQAQRRRGSENESSLLRRSNIREELQLGEDQITKLDELQKQASPGREVMDPFLERMRATDDEEERAKIREELNAAVAKAGASFENNAIDVLDDTQKQALRRIFIRDAGFRAMLDARVQADLGLSAEQKEQIAKLGEERQAASQALGFGATPEQREAFNKEWEAKFVDALTDPQQTMWQGQTTQAAATPAPGAVESPSVSVATPGAETAVMRSQEPPEGAEVVSTFGGPAADAGPDEIVDSFSFNFRYAPWEPILVDFAAAAGYTLDLSEPPPGTLTHIDDNTYTARETLNIINGYLLRRGYILLLKDGFMVCVNTDKGIDPVLVPDVDLADLDQVGDNELVRIRLQIDGVDVGVMAREVEALVGRIGTMKAFTQTGTFIITDIGANLRRINLFVIDALNMPKADDQIFKAYPLRNISVDEAEPLLLTQFGMRQGAANVSESARDRERRSSSSRSSTTTSAQGLQVASDQRTNSLFVTGNKKQHALVEEILKAIDVSEGPYGGPLERFGNTGPFLRVYQVQGDAREVAKSIEAMMPGVVVNEDARNGKVHIFATSRQQKQVAEWMQSFGSGGGSGSVAVITLHRMDPLSAAAMLRNLFLSEGNDAPTIETDLYGRRLIVKGDSGQIEQIKTVLADMGEDGSPVRRSDAGPIRRFSLSGRNPAEFLNFLQDSWEASEANPIRIVVPRQQGPIKELRTPEGPVNFDGSSTTGQGVGESQTRFNEHPRSQAARSSQYVVAVAQEDTAGNASAPATRSAPRAPYEPRGPRDERFKAVQDIGGAENKAEILIYVQGDELILRCEDEEALTRLEDMMDALQQTLPYRTTWTVFYLQSADATEAAAMLEQFFPNSSVSSTSATGGFSMANMFRPVTDAVSDMTGLSGLGMSPQTLRIIPDTRSNSLFVTGPEMVVRDVNQMLQVLDSDEIPESMRDMQPRTIEVKYANIDQVGDIVKEVFKPYTEVQGGKQQQNNPFAALMGGGKGDDASQKIRMTIGVDRQTSSLIIASNAALFEQVQGLVSDMDTQAQMASPGIQIIQLKNADVASVQQSLSALSPRVTTSSTRPSSSSAGGSSGGSSSSPSQAQQDAFRRAMGGGGGNSPFGRGAGGGRQSFGGGISGGRPSFGGRTGGQPQLRGGFSRGGRN